MVVTRCDQLPVFQFYCEDTSRREGGVGRRAKRGLRRRWRASSFAVVGVMFSTKAGFRN